MNNLGRAFIFIAALLAAAPAFSDAPGDTAPSQLACAAQGYYVSFWVFRADVDKTAAESFGRWMMSREAMTPANVQDFYKSLSNQASAKLVDAQQLPAVMTYDCHALLAATDTVGDLSPGNMALGSSELSIDGNLYPAGSKPEDKDLVILDVKSHLQVLERLDYKDVTTSVAGVGTQTQKVAMPTTEELTNRSVVKMSIGAPMLLSGNTLGNSDGKQQHVVLLVAEVRKAG